MTMDDVAKAALGLAITAIGGTLGWLARLVVGTRERVLEIEAKLTASDVRVGNVERAMLTSERAREVIELALDKRDQLSLQRKQEWSKLNNLEIRAIVAEEMERIFPRILHELRGSTPEQGHRTLQRRRPISDHGITPPPASGPAPKQD